MSRRRSRAITYADTQVAIPKSGALRVRAWQPRDNLSPTAPVFVSVHPWAVLGGGEHNTEGLARQLASRHGAIVLTFKLRGSGAIWGALSSHSAEVAQVKAVTRWASAHFAGRKIVLLGCSAGAPMAGTCLAMPSVCALVVVGYTLGRLSSVVFGRHYKHVTGSSSSEKPKLFIMAELDEFTSVAQLAMAVAKSKGENNHYVVVPGVGHFDLEAPMHEPGVADVIAEHGVRLGWAAVEDKSEEKEEAGAEPVVVTESAGDEGKDEVRRRSDDEDEVANDDDKDAGGGGAGAAADAAKK